MTTSREDSDLAATRWIERGFSADVGVDKATPKPKNGTHIMLDCSKRKIEELTEKHQYEFWQLRTPLTAYGLAGVPYGLDNGCFSGDIPKAWDRLLEEAKKAPPLWACSPDVVGSARRTLELWPRFARKMNGIPRALVLQDGIGEFDIPWGEVACVFIGGSDTFKESAEARHAAIAARLLGKWVHVGRVNTVERLAQWVDIADSIDGSGISRDPRETQLGPVVAALKRQKAKERKAAMRELESQVECLETPRSSLEHLF